MNKRIFLLSLILFMAIISSHAQIYPADSIAYPKREVRAVWLTTLSGLDWPKAKATSEEGRKKQKEELCDILDQLQSCGINAVFLQTRVRGSVIYPSQMEPWDIALTGQFDKDPGYDPLSFAIEETHRRGMELHAWVVTIPCFKIASAAKMGKKCLTKTHPQWLIKHSDSYYFDPGVPEVAGYLSDLCCEIVKKYDVDGLHFDYIRYPEKAESFSDSKTYREYGKKQDKAAWRRNNITSIVQRIYRDVKDLKPWIRVSCSPVGKYNDISRYSARGWSAFGTVHQDAQGWLRQGIMDMLCPMMYFTGDHFYPFASDWQENSYGRTVAPGLGIYMMHPKEKDWDFGVIQRELCYLRQEGLQGQTYFRSRFLTDNTKGLFDYLSQTYYPYPALMPAMVWSDSTHPDKPILQKRERVDNVMEQLVWQPVSKAGQPCRYVVYACPRENMDIENPQNIMCILRAPEYTYNQLTAYLYNLKIAITALDRFGNESEPLILESNF